MADEPPVDEVDDAAQPSETERIDRRAHDLVLASYHEEGADIFTAAGPEQLSIDKKAADKLVRARLAWYPDEGRDRLLVTNSGRYWALNGGYMAFLKEDPPTVALGRAAAIPRWKPCASPT